MRNIYNVITDVEGLLLEYNLKFKVRFKGNSGSDSIYRVKVWQRNTYVPAKFEFLIDYTEGGDSVVGSCLSEGDLSPAVIQIIRTSIMDAL